MKEVKILELTGSIKLSEVTKDIIPSSNYENFNTIFGIDVLNDSYSKKVGFIGVQDIWKTNNILIIKDLLVRYLSKTAPVLGELLNVELGNEVVKDEVLKSECMLISSVIYYQGEEYHVNGTDLQLVMYKFDQMTKDKKVSKDIHVMNADKYAEFMKLYGRHEEGDLDLTMLFLCSGLVGGKEEGDPRFFIVSCSYNHLEA